MYIFNTTQSELRVIPSDYNGGTITVSLRNEFTDEQYTNTVTSVGYFNGILRISFNPITFTEGTDIDVTVYENGAVTYKGKAYVTDQTDIENFKLWL